MTHDPYGFFSSFILPVRNTLKGTESLPDCYDCTWVFQNKTDFMKISLLPHKYNYKPSQTNFHFYLFIKQCLKYLFTYLHASAYELKHPRNNLMIAYLENRGFFFPNCSKKKKRFCTFKVPYRQQQYDLQ